MLEIMKENAAIRKMTREEKIIKPKVPTVFENMDETDIFFLSMSKMTKQLPQVEQAKIKLLLSNSLSYKQKLEILVPQRFLYLFLPQIYLEQLHHHLTIL